jgi:WD40 repeat protein
LLELDNGDLLSKSDGSSLIKIWSVKTGELVKSIDCGVKFASGFILINYNKLAFIDQRDESIQIWNLSSDRFEKTLVDVDQLPEINSDYGKSQLIQLSNGNLIYSNTSDESLTIWDVENGQVLRRFGNDLKLCPPILALPGDRIAVANRNKIDVWNANTGEL